MSCARRLTKVDIVRRIVPTWQFTYKYDVHLTFKPNTKYPEMVLFMGHLTYLNTKKVFPFNSRLEASKFVQKLYDGYCVTCGYSLCAERE